ncbi:MAG: hypothetical protein Q7S65_01365 [Nanoarchaeota archaeon]|nr:hypothetical protein [Nanoarchaeota archaeon]
MHTIKKLALEILIGDDLFLEFMTRYTVVPSLTQRLQEGILDYTVNVSTETDPEKVIQRARQYDVVVTDLDYTGDGTGRQGFQIVDAVAQMNPKPLLILCTSSDRHAEIKERTAGKVDYVAGLGADQKFEDLIGKLIQHYSS